MVIMAEHISLESLNSPKSNELHVTQDNKPIFSAVRIRKHENSLSYEDVVNEYEGNKFEVEMITENSNKNRRKFHKVDQGYAWVILMASCVAHVTFGFVIYSFSILYDDLVEHFNSKYGIIGWIGSITVGTLGCLGICLGLVVDRVGCRMSCMIGGLTMGIGITMSSVLINIPYLCFTYGIILGLGAGLTLLSSVVAVQRTFNKKLAFANGLRTASVNIGGLISGPLLRYLIDTYGLRGALLLEGAVLLQAVVCGAFYRNDAVEKNEICARNNAKEEMTIDTADKNCCRWNKSPMTDSSVLIVLKNKQFLIYLSSLFLQNLSLHTYFTHLVNYALFMNIEKGVASFLPLILNIGICVGAIGFGVLANLPGYKRWLQMTVSGIFAGSLVMCTLLVKTFPTIATITAVNGIIGGSLFAVEVTNLMDFMDVEHVTQGMAFVQMVFGVASLAGIPLGGFLVDISEGYTLAYIFAGSMELGGAVLFFVIFILQQKSHKYLHAEYQKNTPEHL